MAKQLVWFRLFIRFHTCVEEISILSVCLSWGDVTRFANTTSVREYFTLVYILCEIRAGQLSKDDFLKPVDNLLFV